MHLYLIVVNVSFIRATGKILLTTYPKDFILKKPKKQIPVLNGLNLTQYQSNNPLARSVFFHSRGARQTLLNTYSWSTSSSIFTQSYTAEVARLSDPRINVHTLSIKSYPL